MKNYHDEEEGDPAIEMMSSSYVSRDEIQSGFRGMRYILWGLVILMCINFGAILLFSGDRSLIVALSSDGHMQVLSRLSDTVYQKNFSRIVRYFSTEFLSNLTAYDSFEISYRLEKALAVMTPDFRVRMKREILAQNLLETVQKAKIHTVLSIKNLNMHRVTHGVWSVELSGERATYAFGQQSRRLQGFSARLLIRRGASTVFNPYGLWVENYQESSTNSLSEPVP